MFVTTSETISWEMFMSSSRRRRTRTRPSRTSTTDGSEDDPSTLNLLQSRISEKPVAGEVLYQVSISCLVFVCFSVLLDFKSLQCQCLLDYYSTVVWQLKLLTIYHCKLNINHYLLKYPIGVASENDFQPRKATLDSIKSVCQSLSHQSIHGALISIKEKKFIFGLCHFLYYSTPPLLCDSSFCPFSM